MLLPHPQGDAIRCKCPFAKVTASHFETRHGRVNGDAYAPREAFALLPTDRWSPVPQALSPGCPQGLLGPMECDGSNVWGLLTLGPWASILPSWNPTPTQWNLVSPARERARVETRARDMTVHRLRRSPRGGRRVPAATRPRAPDAGQRAATAAGQLLGFTPPRSGAGDTHVAFGATSGSAGSPPVRN